MLLITLTLKCIHQGPNDSHLNLKDDESFPEVALKDFLTSVGFYTELCPKHVVFLGPFFLPSLELRLLTGEIPQCTLYQTGVTHAPDANNNLKPN